MFRKFTFAIAMAGLATIASATPVTESLLQDVFSYEGLPTSNFQSGMFSSFNTVISSGASNTGHTLHGLVQFNTAGVHADAGETATLNLFSVAGPVGGVPSAGFAVTTELYAVTSDWDDDTVTWNSEPSHGATLIASATVNGINKWISFDITNWINSNPVNKGLYLSQPTVVLNGSGQAVAASFASSDSGSNTPIFQVAVPEPASIASVGLVGLLALRRRRRAQMSS